MTRSDALQMAADLVTKVRVAPNPADLARAAVLPLQLRSAFSPEEIREVASFLYLMKRRNQPADADFVARALSDLLTRLGHSG
ncbi:MAG: hypothetical protein DI570_16665 [Phenylobacterium zucineum]|nr:MAG: hypothetical protein DI570_16665 [Phenylobacterium zucineum]